MIIKTDQIDDQDKKAKAVSAVIVHQDKTDHQDKKVKVVSVAIVHQDNIVQDQKVVSMKTTLIWVKVRLLTLKVASEVVTVVHVVVLVVVKPVVIILRIRNVFVCIFQLNIIKILIKGNYRSGPYRPRRTDHEGREFDRHSGSEKTYKLNEFIIMKM